MGEVCVMVWYREAMSDRDVPSSVLRESLD
jgi:hypothetical protein